MARAISARSRELQESPGQAETWSGPIHLRQSALAAVVPPFVVSRLALVALTCVLALTRHQSVLHAWRQWDGRWYLGIAAHGYHWGVNGKPSLAFFPLYPLLLHMGMSLDIPGVLVAIVLSNLAFAVSLYYLYNFVAMDRGPFVARRALWLLAVFPTAFFTFAPYTEALFLLCAVGALYHAQRGDPLPAGLWTAAAILTRSTGIILLLAILVTPQSSRLRSYLVRLLPSVVVACGYACYLVSQHIAPVQVLLAQRDWHRGLTYPWTGFTTSISWLAHHGLGNIPWAAEDAVQLTVTLVFLLLTGLAWRELGTTSAVYCVGFWMLVLTSPQWRDGYYAPFSSMDRFVLGLFPLAAWAAKCIPTRRLGIGIAISTAAMLGAAAIHLSGGWIG